jgi:hypothetical protein
MAEFKDFRVVAVNAPVFGVTFPILGGDERFTFPPPLTVSIGATALRFDVMSCVVPVMVTRVLKHSIPPT